MSHFFPKSFQLFGKNITVKLDLSYYTTQDDLKRASEVDTSNLASKFDLTSLKNELNKIDVNRLDVDKLSNILNNEVAKKTVYDKLAAKVNNIDTSGFVLKTKYGEDKSDLKKN